MNCILCNSRIIDNEDLKVKCSSCNLFFHAKCVKLEKRDIKNIAKSSQGFKCETCLISQLSKSLNKNALAASGSQSLSSHVPKNLVSPAHAHDITPHSSAPLETINPPSAASSKVNGEQTITLSMLYAEILKLQTLNSDALEKIRFLEERNVTLTDTVSILESKLNSLEQRDKQCDVDIVGIPDVNATNVTDKVLQLINTGVGEQIERDDIESCYVKALKKRGDDSNNAVSNIVCVKFSKLSQKLKIMTKLRTDKVKLSANIFGDNFNNKGKAKNKIFINDSLTAYTRSLLQWAKQLKLQGKCDYVWVRSSSVFIRRKEGEKVIKIKNAEDFSKNNFVFC